MVEHFSISLNCYHSQQTLSIIVEAIMNTMNPSADFIFINNHLTFWNTLHNAIKEICSLDGFKRKITRKLYTVPNHFLIGRIRNLSFTPESETNLVIYTPICLKTILEPPLFVVVYAVGNSFSFLLHLSITEGQRKRNYINN